MIRQISLFALIALSLSAKAADQDQMKKFKSGCVEQLKTAAVHFTYPDKVCDCVGKKFLSFIATVKDPSDVKDDSDYFVLNFTPGGLDGWSQDKIDSQYLMNESITDWERQCLPVGKPKRH